VPVVVPTIPGSTTVEAFTLDGLALNDQVTFGVDSVSWPPPQQRQDWIGAADSEAQLLFRKPLHENRKVTLSVGVIPQPSMDLALAKVAQVVDKLDKAGKFTDGIGLVWAPAGGTLSCTFDVLAGQITDLPIDWENGWLALAPSFTVELTCKPYWRGTETLTSTVSSSTPFVTLDVTATGDVPALGRLIITDTATQSRRHVEWGVEGPLTYGAGTYTAGTSLLVDSDNMVTTGFSGAQAVTSGAYDPNATGNNSVTLTPIAGATTAMAGTGNLTHVGVFRVKARVQSGSLSNQFRFSWQSADGPVNHNDWVLPFSTSGWIELDLGTITVPAVTLGTQRWTGQVEVQGDTATPGTVALDYLILVPQADGYGKARASWSLGTGVITGLDAFVGTTAAGALNTRTAPLGGTWATSGDTTDFVFADNFFGTDGVESIQRTTTVSETTGRTAILGATNYTDMQVEAKVKLPQSTDGPGTESSYIARWVDASNYLRLLVRKQNQFIFYLRIEQVIAGTPTTLAEANVGAYYPHGARLIAYSSGHVVVQYLTNAGAVAAQLDASSSAVATGGTLQTGKPGLRDRSVGAGTALRTYTNFAVSTPAPEPIALYSGRSMQVRYDVTERQDLTGTYYGRPPSYRGSRFLLQPGTSRVLVKARRNDIEAALDDQVTDATQIQVGWTPRGLVVPRA
jgi:hypothetical protein